MERRQEKQETPVGDWRVLLIVSAPYLLVIIGPILDVQPSLALTIGLHYSIYLVLLLGGAILFVLGGLGRDSSWLKRRLPLVVTFVFVWDIITPLTDIASFALLKSLLYLFVVLQLSPYSLLRYGKTTNKPSYQILLILLLTAIMFFNQVIQLPFYSYALNAQSFLRTVLSREFLSLGAMISMVGLPVVLLIRPDLIGGKRSYHVTVAAGAMTFLLAANEFLGSLSQYAIELKLSAATFELLSSIAIYLPFSVQLPCLYLYLLVLGIYGGEDHSVLGKSLDVGGLLGVVFSMSFMFLYWEANRSDISRALLEVARYQGVIGYWGNVLLVSVGLVTAAITLVEFNRRKVAERGARAG